MGFRFAARGLGAALAMLAAPATASTEEGAPPAAEVPKTEVEDAGSGVTGSVELVSDYRYRGVSLSGGRPAVQLGAEYAHSSGFFAGAWGSTIAEEEGADTELDVYAGYSGSLPGIGYTLTATRYVYPGGAGLDYFDFTSEFEAEIRGARVTLEAAYAPKQKNTGTDNLYTALEVAYDFASPAVTGFARAGREDGFYDNKWDWELGLRHERGPISLRASFVATSNKDDGEPTVVAGAAFSF